MNAISLNHLWSYLQGLSLTSSNQRWLGEQLIAASTSTVANATLVRKGDSLRQTVYKRRKALSDEELAARLSQYAILTAADFPDVSREDYANYIRENNGHL